MNTSDSHYPDTHHDAYSKTIFGFWLYLLTDFVLFATILAVYFVLRHGTFGGPSAKDLLPLSFTCMQSVFLLLSAFFSGLGNTYAHKNEKKKTAFLYGVTFLMGLIFLGMVFSGFSTLIQEGNDWSRSAFLSAYFTLVGTHAFHVVAALIWTVVFLPLIWLRGFTSVTLQRLTCLRLFWQFINMIWVGIFTMVYLMGVN